ncbi:hypothetical protein FACS1894170_06080 [Planctomycetales bacterium]|nr:hypothetical protein FACS1894170_06080 [Planctomycetales bacterium]
MNLKLLVDNGKNDKSIPLPGNTFVIGRADDCQLRSRSQAVSRHHCVIQNENGAVIIKDLGSNNGVFVNNIRLSKDGSQTLRHGDRVVVGPHRFIVQTAANDTSAVGGNSLELSSVQSQNIAYTDTDTSATALVGTKLPAGVASDEDGVNVEVNINGVVQRITKKKLFALARQGKIHPDDLVIIGGTKFFADSFEGIVFGQPGQPLPEEKSQISNPNVAADGTAPEPFPFDDIGADVPVVFAHRNERPLRELWNALDISFGRVYDRKGNAATITLLKGIYFLVALGLAFVVLLFLVNAGIKINDEVQKSGNVAAKVQEFTIFFTIVAVGSFMLLAVLRFLFEMLIQGFGDNE